MDNKKILIALIAVIVAIIIIIITIFSLKPKSNEENDRYLHNTVSDAGNVDTSDRLSINITNIDEIKGKIENYNKFQEDLKKYLSENGIINFDTLNMEQYQENNGVLKIRFKANDENQTNILVTINLSENTYSFNNYR